MRLKTKGVIIRAQTHRFNSISSSYDDQIVPKMTDSMPDVYCLSGEGRYYVCETGSKFVGCCKRSPCYTGCNEEDLLPSYFKASEYGKFPDLVCKSGKFYTCQNAVRDGYSGCCRVDPCQEESGTGCPPEHVAGAYLPNDTHKAEYYLTLNATSTPRHLNSTDRADTPQRLAGEVVAFSHRIPPIAVAAFVALMFGVAISIAAVMPCLSRLIYSKVTWPKRGRMDR